MYTFNAISQYAIINKADPLNIGNIFLNLLSASALRVPVKNSKIIQKLKMMANPKNKPKKKFHFKRLHGLNHKSSNFFSPLFCDNQGNKILNIHVLLRSLDQL